MSILTLYDPLVLMWAWLTLLFSLQGICDSKVKPFELFESL